MSIMTPSLRLDRATWLTPVLCPASPWRINSSRGGRSSSGTMNNASRPISSSGESNPRMSARRWLAYASLLSWTMKKPATDCSIMPRNCCSDAARACSASLRSEMSRSITLERSSPSLAVNIAEVTSAGNRLPSPRMTVNSPRNRPVPARSCNPAARRGSDASNSPERPNRRISSSLRCNIWQAAALASRMRPSGAPSMTASSELLNNRR